MMLSAGLTCPPRPCAPTQQGGSKAGRVDKAVMRSVKDELRLATEYMGAAASRVEQVWRNQPAPGTAEAAASAVLPGIALASSCLSQRMHASSRAAKGLAHLLPPAAALCAPCRWSRCATCSWGA